jgi:hypothetical protein
VVVDGSNVIDVVDPVPLPAGSAGFYAYNNGGCDAGLCDTDFDDARIWALDEDADTIADDVDDCEAIANTDQLDTDGDGEGDLCDATPGTTESDTDTDADTDSDTDTDADTDSDSDADTDADTDTDTDGTSTTGGEVLIVGHGCDATGGIALGAIGIGAALLATRRRRQR